MNPNTPIIPILVKKIREFFRRKKIDSYIPDRLKDIANQIRKRKY